jgi:lipopolysaccharide cholinephosphotransferase
MKISEIVNEYELDWVRTSLTIKVKGVSITESLRDKQILIIGHSKSYFTRSIVYAFLYINDILNINLSVQLVLFDNGSATLYEKLLDREDISITDISVIDKDERTTLNKCECNQAISSETGDNRTIINEDEIRKNSSDFAIFTAWCNESIASEDLYEECFASCNRALRTVAERHIKKLILFSDYRSYGLIGKPCQIAEYETGAINPIEESSFIAEVLQTCEMLCSCYAKQYEFEFVILRTGVIYGPEVRFSNNPLYNLINLILNEDNISIDVTKEKFTYVYISDVILTIIWSLIRLPVDTSYNLTGYTATLPEIINVISNNFPGLAKVSLNYGKDINAYGTSLDGSKIRRYGMKPSIGFSDGLVLVLKSRLYPNELFLFDDTYKGKLDIIHEILLAYLLDIDRICKKHNIKYFLAGGTLLGAVRHHGFIPWDDDADVMMLREDYDKFLQIVQDELAGNQFLQIPATEKSNHCVFTKIRLNNTIFATKFTSNFMQMHNGIFVDILAHDQTSNRKIIQKIHLRLTRIFRTFVFRKWGNAPLKGNKLNKFVGKITTKIMRWLPFSFWEFLQEKALTWYRKRNTDYLYDGMGRNIKKGVFPKEWLSEAIYVDFEGQRFPIPKEYNNYLTYLYGDYMNMISVSKRKVSHSIVLMDLGEYAYFKVKNNESEKTQ